MVTGKDSTKAQKDPTAIPKQMNGEKVRVFMFGDFNNFLTKDV